MSLVFGTPVLVHPLHRHLIDFLKILFKSYQSSSILKKRARKKLLTLASNKQREQNPHPSPLITTWTFCSCQMHLVLSPQINFNFLQNLPFLHTGLKLSVMTLLLSSLVAKHPVFTVKPSYNSYSWVTKRIIVGYSWGQDFWRRERSNNEQREKLNCNTIATETSANSWSSGGGMILPVFQLRPIYTLLPPPD